MSPLCPFWFCFCVPINFNNFIYFQFSILFYNLYFIMTLFYYYFTFYFYFNFLFYFYTSKLCNLALRRYSILYKRLKLKKSNVYVVKRL
jgi:hypothetical protein